MPQRGRGRTGRSPMDRAADGMENAGQALANVYEALRQGLPMAAVGAARALDALERIASAADRIERRCECGPSNGFKFCADCGGLEQDWKPQERVCVCGMSTQTPYCSNCGGLDPEPMRG